MPRLSGLDRQRQLHEHGMVKPISPITCRHVGEWRGDPPDATAYCGVLTSAGATRWEPTISASSSPGNRTITDIACS